MSHFSSMAAAKRLSRAKTASWCRPEGGDLRPEAGNVAPEADRQGVVALDSGRYDLIVVNFANGDMVGHTGVLAAAIKAVEPVDVCLGGLAEAVRSRAARSRHRRPRQLRDR